MKKHIKILALMLVFLFAFSAAGCSSKIDTMKRIKENKEVIWGTNAAFAPFEMREGEEVIGIDSHIAQKIADKLSEKLGTDISLKVIDMDFEALPAALTKSGDIDFIAAGFTVTEEREKSMTFSMKYFKAVQVVIVMNDDDSIKEASDLEGKRLGVQNGTTGDLYVASETEGAVVHRYNNGVEAVMGLKNGDVDAVIIDDLPAQILANKNPEVKILDLDVYDDEEYALAVRKGDNELKEVIDEVLKEMQDSGELEELVNQYSLGE